MRLRRQRAVALARARARQNLDHREAFAFDILDLLIICCELSLQSLIGWGQCQAVELSRMCTPREGNLVLLLQL